MIMVRHGDNTTTEISLFLIRRVPHASSSVVTYMSFTPVVLEEVLATLGAFCTTEDPAPSNGSTMVTSRVCCIINMP
jgi:hypothetical protein